MNATGVMTMGYGQCIMESVLRRRRQGGMGLLSKGENEGEDLLTPYSRRTRRFQRRWARLGISFEKRIEKDKEMYIRTQLIAGYCGLWPGGRPRAKKCSILKSLVPSAALPWLVNWSCMIHPRFRRIGNPCTNVLYCSNIPRH